MKKLLCLIPLFSILNFTYGQMEEVKSILEIYDVKSDTRTILYTEDDHFEAPNWSRDGKFLVLNSKGKLFRLDIENKTKIVINTDFADKCNNDHGISPDGSQLVISHHDQPNISFSKSDYRTSRIYTLPSSGGKPKVVTNNIPSFWHGWSPDGKKLIYTALRNGDFDIYSIGVEGGDEKRLTNEPGLDDGPDYSYDGNFIYYNSMQSRKMEVWRMRADGTGKVQLTDDEFSNWFPHPSPDGKYFVYLSYLEDQGSGHPGMKNVMLRLFNIQTKTIKNLCSFTGGQGTINVPSWSPDGNRFAFVSYEFID